MAYLVIPLTVIALIALGYIIIHGIFIKEKEAEEITDDSSDEEHNTVLDDYGENKLDF